MRPSNTILHHHSIISPCWMIYVWQDASVGPPHVIAPAGVLQPPVTWFRYKVSPKVAKWHFVFGQGLNILTVARRRVHHKPFQCYYSKGAAGGAGLRTPCVAQYTLRSAAQSWPAASWMVGSSGCDMGHIIRPSLLQSTGSVTNQSQDTTMEPRNTGCPDFQ